MKRLTVTDEDGTVVSELELDDAPPARLHPLVIGAVNAMGQGGVANVMAITGRIAGIPVHCIGLAFDHPDQPNTHLLAPVLMLIPHELLETFQADDVFNDGEPPPSVHSDDVPQDFADYPLNRCPGCGEVHS